jgi:L-lactate dehydrogenase (cytochrome)
VSSRPALERRRAPRPAEIRDLLGPAPSRSVPRRLRGAHTVQDVRRIARRAAPRPVFDFVDGAAEDEITAARSRAAFDRVEFRPRALTGVTDADATTTLVGTPSAMPVALAPTGFTRLSHRLGELAVARAAARHRVPYVLSTFGTVSIEELATWVPDASRWFQLYVLRDRGLTASLVERAAASAYSALVVTVDSVVSGNRVRDLRNGLAIPPALTARSVARFAARPRWSYDLLTSSPLELASLREASSGDLWSLLKELADPSFAMGDLPWLRDLWPGPLVLKGVLSADDAAAAADAGADAIVLSNHGGRQLDRTPVGLELLGEVVERVGDRVEVYVDGGVRSGSDVCAAVGLGARGCLVGRPYLYGLMAAGEAGVDHVLSLLETDVVRTLRLLGVPSVAALATAVPELVRLRDVAW